MLRKWENGKLNTLTDILAACSELRDAKSLANRVTKSVTAFYEWGRRYCLRNPSDVFLFSDYDAIISDLPVDETDENLISLQLIPEENVTQSEQESLNESDIQSEQESMYAQGDQREQESLNESGNQSEQESMPPPKRKKNMRLEWLRQWALESSSESLNMSNSFVIDDNDKQCMCCLKACNDENIECVECHCYFHLKCVGVQPDEKEINFICYTCNEELHGHHSLDMKNITTVSNDDDSE